MKYIYIEDVKTYYYEINKSSNFAMRLWVPSCLANDRSRVMQLFLDHSPLVPRGVVQHPWSPAETVEVRGPKDAIKALRASLYYIYPTRARSQSVSPLLSPPPSNLRMLKSSTTLLYSPPHAEVRGAERGSRLAENRLKQGLQRWVSPGLNRMASL